MASIRILEQCCSPSSVLSELHDRALEVRRDPACIQFEYFRSIETPEHFALVQLWTDLQAYEAHWAKLAEAGLSYRFGRPAPIDRAAAQAAAEFYQQAHFKHVDGQWALEDEILRPKAISWPARGPIRIVIQSSQEGFEERFLALIANSVETRREPGCDQFGWFRSTEFPEAFLLLELWSDQQLYDAHWYLRLRTGRGGRPATAKSIPRRHGTNGAEFYRHQPYKLLYNVWMPEDAERWSKTISWPD